MSCPGSEGTRRHNHIATELRGQARRKTRNGAGGPSALMDSGGARLVGELIFTGSLREIRRNKRNQEDAKRVERMLPLTPHPLMGCLNGPAFGRR